VTEVVVNADDSPVEELAIDAELADSFPASDPPSWTSGIAETRPQPNPSINRTNPRQPCEP
jgi:hypothetical protein